MRVRSSLRRRRAVGLALAACSLALVIPATASARTDVTSHRHAPASAVQTQDLRPPTVVSVVDHGDQTLAIVFSSTALFLALAAVGFAAVYRRPRPRWSAS
jgi:hypothetical protein